MPGDIVLLLIISAMFSSCLEIKFTFAKWNLLFLSLSKNMFTQKRIENNKTIYLIKIENIKKLIKVEIILL